MRVVVDTNVIVSRIITPNGYPAKVLQQSEKGAFTLLLSEAILNECLKVLRYQRLRARHKLGDDEINEAVELLRNTANIVQVEMQLKVVSADPDDDKFIECAISGGADYIVSGDAHLLMLGEYNGIRILSPANFLALLSEE